MDDVLSYPLPQDMTSGQVDELNLSRLWAIKRNSCPATHAHEIGVGVEVRALSRFLGWDKASVDDFSKAAQFHDVGKILTPKEVLWKPGMLSAEEFAVMKRHAADGAVILGTFSGMIGEVGAQMANFHHERPDGLGYHGLRSQETPVFARICAVADVFEALTSSHRSYKAAFSVGETLTLMVRDAEPGKLGRAQFDHAALHSFARLKLETSREQIDPVSKDAIEDFVRQGGVSRKAEIHAFKIGLDFFSREFGKDRNADANLAARFRLLASRDKELKTLMTKHEAMKKIALINSSKNPVAAESKKRGGTLGR